MKVLLDTCAFIWLTTDATELSERVKSVFQDTDNLVYLGNAGLSGNRARFNCIDTGYINFSISCRIGLVI